MATGGGVLGKTSLTSTNGVLQICRTQNFTLNCIFLEWNDLELACAPPDHSMFYYDL